MFPDPDADLRQDLARHRAFASGLLAMMAVLVGVSYALPAGEWADLLQASAKAGFIGGIADWFAITALFRHPLGLPIPHTAIIPKQKARLGRALGRFVAGHVITPAEVSRVPPGSRPAGHPPHRFALPHRPKSRPPRRAGPGRDAAPGARHRAGRPR